GILMTWSWILDSAPNNVANYYLLRLGVIDKAIGWFDTPSLAWMWIIIVTVWWLCGFGVLLYLGALERIPPEQYESAKIDGAGPWASFWHVTLPWIRNVLLFDVARNVILAFGLFDQVLILTAGGPGGATRTLVYYLYLTGFQRQQFGRAAAVAWYIFVVTALFGVVQLLLLGKSVKAVEE
ncbi:MAG: sugar ABC transporter permease, partial [Candidatus Methanomethyliaceae archaeon]